MMAGKSNVDSFFANNKLPVFVNLDSDDDDDDALFGNNAIQAKSQPIMTKQAEKEPVIEPEKQSTGETREQTLGKRPAARQTITLDSDDDDEPLVPVTKRTHAVHSDLVTLAVVRMDGHPSQHVEIRKMCKPADLFKQLEKLRVLPVGSTTYKLFVGSPQGEEMERDSNQSLAFFGLRKDGPNVYLCKSVEGPGRAVDETQALERLRDEHRREMERKEQERENEFNNLLSSGAAAQQATAADEAEERVAIKFAGPRSIGEVKFRVLKANPFSKLYDILPGKLTTLQGVAFKLKFDGETIEPDDTPASLDLEDEDQIDIVLG